VHAVYLSRRLGWEDEAPLPEVEVRGGHVESGHPGEGSAVREHVMRHSLGCLRAELFMTLMEM
jgi:hypothetical protein